MTGAFIRVVIMPMAAVAVAVLAAMLFLWLTGYPALATFREIVSQCFQDWYGFGQVLRAMTLLIFTGLAVAVAFQGGLFNIGVEGQLYIGSISVAIAGYYLSMMPASALRAMPWFVMLAIFIIIAMLTAGLWGLIPGALKAATGAHEVISTIMMNFIAYALVNYLVRPSTGSYAIPGTLHTPAIPPEFRMPRLSQTMPVFQGSVVNYSIVVALAAAVLVYVMLRFTRLGFEVRAVGANPDAARLAGISPGKIAMTVMFISGALGGLVGIDFVLGYKGYFEENFSAGLGFIGIAVALLANNHPLGVIITAFLFAVLNYGEVAAAGEVPKDIIEVMEAAIIIFMLAGNRIFSKIASKRM
ncbi:MAG: ABC transporter permease [bacterium]|nr:ABC transporter permease [Candidatus Sumerlaeota bacterium]